MSWHLSWQDPVALLVVLLALGLTFWLRRRFAGGGCSGCATPQDRPLIPPRRLLRKPARHAILLACLIASPGYAAPRERGKDKKADSVEVCITWSTRARSQIYFHDHLVDIKSTCKSDAACVVTTSANQEAVKAEVPAGQTVEVLTFSRSPVQEFTADVKCTLKR